MDDAFIYSVLYWIGAGLVWAISAWTIVSTIVEVARGRSKPGSRDVIAGVLFHAGTAIAAVKLANLAVHGV
ncbi:MAG: hypothetical protein GY854_13715 [Deltaproteobacteria bacterium]|nr:hypothetical protein [Deltaproteobacteria bacterium]